MDIYRENIIDHYKNPRNKGNLEDYDYKAEDENTSCDDKMIIQIKMNEKIIEDVKFNGIGCAISIASASMLTENVKGKTLEEVKQLTHKDIFNLINVELDALRTKCATLSLQTLKKALGVKNA